MTAAHKAESNRRKWENAQTKQRRRLQGAGDEEIGFFGHTDHGDSGHAGRGQPSAPRRRAAHQVRGKARQPRDRGGRVRAGCVRSTGGITDSGGCSLRYYVSEPSAVPPEPDLISPGRRVARTGRPGHADPALPDGQRVDETFRTYGSTLSTFTWIHGLR